MVFEVGSWKRDRPAGTGMLGGAGCDGGRRGSERVWRIVDDVFELDTYRVSIVPEPGGEFDGEVEDLGCEALRRDQRRCRSVRALGRGEDGVGGVESTVDGEEGGVGENDDEQLRREVEIVGGGVRDTSLTAHDRSSA